MFNLGSPQAMLKILFLSALVQVYRNFVNLGPTILSFLNDMIGCKSSISMLNATCVTNSRQTGWY